MMMINVILVDEHDNPIGTEEKIKAHKTGALHRAISVFLLANEDDTLYTLLQQRQFTKYHSPGLLTNSCCSHPLPGEKTQDAAQRRLREELNISAPLNEIDRFIYRAEFPNGLIEHEFDHIFVGFYDKNKIIAPNPDEVASTQWQPLAKAIATAETEPELYTPWFVLAAKPVLSWWQKQSP